MRTLPQPKAPRKAFYAIMDDDQHGVLTMDEHGAVWFRNEATNALTLITPEMYPFVQALGEVALAEAQKMDDVRRGGHAAIACNRVMVEA
jgi:hypothetical protein